MANPLFSTYIQGENRVTATLLAVLERLSFALVERILQALCQEPETPLLTFSNQPRGLASVPDARIRASFAYWIETKTEVGAVRREQIENHLLALNADQEVSRSRLLVLTPDERIPSEISGISDARLAWANFDDLVRIMQELTEGAECWLTSELPQVTEQDRVLLRELVRSLMAEKLVGRSQNRAVVVAARVAYPEYLRHSVYMCQPNRAFQPCTHMEFYSDGHIKVHIAKILGAVEHVVLSHEGVATSSSRRQQLTDLVIALANENSDRFGEEAKVLFLSPSNAPDTIILEHEISNDLTAQTGRTVAFTQGQRYVSLKRLQANPKATSELAGESVL